MLEMKFLSASLEFIDRKIDFFERNDAQIHNLYDEMGLILSRYIQIFMKDRVLVEEVDEEGNLVYKKFEALLEVDPKDEKNWKSRSEISLGSPAEAFLKKLELSPDSAHLDNFFNYKVIPFYSKIVEMLQKYFSKGLKSRILEACSFLGPAKKSSPGLLSKLKFLGSKYEKVLALYSETTNFKEEFESQVIDYQRLDLGGEVMESTFVDFWIAVGKVTVGGQKNRLKFLSKFALALGTQFNSNSKIERQFKNQSNIHADKSRNSLDQEMLDSYLTIRSGVESLQVVNRCEKCKKDAEKIALGELKVPRYHCHCSLAKPSDKMVEKCRTARKTYGKELEGKKKEKQENEESLAERRKVTEIVMNEELEQWKEDLHTRSSFLEDESLEIPPVKSKQPKKVAKQSTAKTPTTAKNRVASRGLQVKRKLGQPALPANVVKKKKVQIVADGSDSMMDITTAADVDEEEEAVNDEEVRRATEAADHVTVTDSGMIYLGI